MVKRNDNIETLRVVAMLFIVLGHVCVFRDGGGIVEKGVASFGVWATNVFAFITGWYGMRFKPEKIYKMLALGLYAAFLLCIGSYFMHGGVRFAYSLGWFGNAYLALFLLSPLINAAIETLTKNDDVRPLRNTWIIYSFAMLLNWLPLSYFNIDLKMLGFEAHSVNQLLYIYVTAQYLRRSGFYEHFTLVQMLVSFIVLAVVGFVWSAVAGFLHTELMRSLFVGTRDYNSPLVLLMSVSLFGIFNKVDTFGRLGNVCVFLAPSMFSIYLIHEGCNRYVSREIYNKYAYLNFSQSILGTLMSLVVAALIVFAICLLLDLIRRLFVGVLQKAVNLKRR